MEFPNKGFHIIGLTEVNVLTPDDIYECIGDGSAQKVVASTGTNARSSRSHSSFNI